jgi:cytochrome c553
MKKLMVSAFALAMMTTGAMAGQPVTLTSTQLDKVSAGFFNDGNINRTRQKADADATAVAVCGACAFNTAVAEAEATNVNITSQSEDEF